MVLEIYSFNMSSFCRAVLATAKELKLDYKLIEMDIKENGKQFSPEFLKVNPAHSIPMIKDDGFVLWESRAIMRYLCDKYQPNGTLYPKDLKKRAIVDRWLDFDMSLVNSSKKSILLKPMLGVEPTEEQCKSFFNNMKLMDQLIGDNKFLTGDQLTIADLITFSNTQFVVALGTDMSAYTNFLRWFNNVQNEMSYFSEIYMSATIDDMTGFVVKNQDYLKRKMNE